MKHICNCGVVCTETFAYAYNTGLEYIMVFNYVVVIIFFSHSARAT